MTSPASSNAAPSARELGERAELERLLATHLKAVWSLAFQLVLDPAAADDLAQEACLRAIRGYSKFRGGSAFRTWLFRIVINTSRDLYAKGGRSKCEADADQPFDPPARSHESPERVAMQTELEQEISRAMADLPEPLRVALVLTTIHGLTPDEVADMEGCAINTIYGRVHEARKILKQKLEPWVQ